MTEGLSTTAFLREISTRLTHAAAVARAALGCAEGGSEREALRIALDIDETVFEIKLLHGAMVLAGRIDRSKAGG